MDFNDDFFSNAFEEKFKQHEMILHKLNIHQGKRDLCFGDRNKKRPPSIKDFMKTDIKTKRNGEEKIFNYAVSKNEFENIVKNDKILHQIDCSGGLPYIPNPKDPDEPAFLKMKNKHPLDKEIVFRDLAIDKNNPGHKYWILNPTTGQYENIYLRSGSQMERLISDDNFEKEKTKIAGRVLENLLELNKRANIQLSKMSNATKKEREDMLRRIYGEKIDIAGKSSVRQIIDVWNNSSVLGTELHLCIEYYYNGIQREISDKIAREWGYFLNYIDFMKEDHPELIPYRTEWKIFSRELHLAGMIDMVYEQTIKDENGNEEKVLHLYDWKRTKGLNSRPKPYGKFKAPLDSVPKSKHHKYYLQLNIYKFIIEREFGRKVVDMKIVVFHPANDNYVIVNVPLMEKEVIRLIQYHLEDIKRQALKDKRILN